ncbi:MAG: class I SAM-dependent rRNA methyltransferase [Gammaproteobacteria bacterium]
MTETASTLPELRLKSRQDRRLRGGHLWVYSNEVDVANTPLKGFAGGDIVRVVSDKGQFLGYAGVHPNALIAARILSREAAHPPGRALFEYRLRSAKSLRDTLYGNGHYRLLFGESDGMPGLVADRFGDVIVLQAATAAMERFKGKIIDAVKRELAPSGILWRNDGGARDLEQLDRYVELAWGEVPEQVPVLEGGLEFSAPVREGQKTGWFFDQRDNRQRFARYPADSVLDVFSYTGAWGLSAAKRGAAATFVDASAQALGWVKEGAARFGVDAELLHGNAFETLRALRDEGRHFDAVVVDPPAFIKRKKDYRSGVTAYQRINQLAMLLLKRDGFLVSCSCSHHLSTADLLAAIQRAARHVDRFVQVVEIGGQSADHPQHPAMPETSYLKALFCRVSVASG